MTSMPKKIIITQYYFILWNPIFKNKLFLSANFYKKILILKSYFLDGWKFYCLLKKKHPILYRIFMFIFRQSLNTLGCGLIINYTKVGKALYSNSGLIFNIIDSEEISTKQLVIGAFIAAIVVIGGLFIKDLLIEVDSNKNDYLNEQAKNKELNKLIRQKDEEIVNLKEQKKSLLEKLEFAGKILKDPTSTVNTYLRPAAANTIAAEANNTSNTLWKMLTRCWAKNEVLTEIAEINNEGFNQVKPQIELANKQMEKVFTIYETKIDPQIKELNDCIADKQVPAEKLLSDLNNSIAEIKLVSNATYETTKDLKNTLIGWLSSKFK